MTQSTITLSFGESSLTYVNNVDKRGKKAETGYSLDDLKRFRKILGGTIYRLACVCEEDEEKEYEVEDAYILIVEGGVSKLVDLEKLKAEQNALDLDKQMFHYGKVCNKKARYNLCFSDIGQQPDFKNKKGTIVEFNNVPETKRLREKLNEIFNENFECEGNYYYDVKKCYIQYHGDGERMRLCAIRLGANFPLFFQWYYKGEKLGKRIDFMLSDGCIYIPSQKGIGNDWKKKNVATVRHAAGFEGVLKI